MPRKSPPQTESAVSTHAHDGLLRLARLIGQQAARQSYTDRQVTGQVP